MRNDVFNRGCHGTGEAPPATLSGATRWAPSVRLLGGLLCAGLLTFSGCAVNPVTGKTEVAFVSESQELAIGQKNYAPYRQAQGGDYVLEPDLQRYVQRVGDSLAGVSDRKLPYEFSIVNDSTPNAWALPGGKISINRGLLVELRSEAELAAVLAHEIVHAAARHSAQSMERGIFLQGALVAAGVALGDSKYREAGLIGAGVGAQLVKQRYGRDAETEADLFGMRYMQRAGYDPAAAVRLQETFVRLAEGRQANWLEGLFASHPPSQERVAANRAFLAELGDPGGEIGESRYQAAIARLLRNKPAYAAFDEAQAALDKGDQAAALRKVNEAIRLEPDEAAFYSLRGQIKGTGKDSRSALRDLDRAVQLNPGYYRPLLVRGMLRTEIGEAQAAGRDLRRSLELLPTAEAHYAMGTLAVQSGQREQAVGHFRSAAAARSAVGTAASQALQRLDLNANPASYLKTGLGLDKAGNLVVKIDNTAQFAVRDLRVAVGIRGAAGLRDQVVVRFDREIAAGKSVQLRTGLGPMDVQTARRYQSAVIQARLVEPGGRSLPLRD